MSLQPELIQLPQHALALVVLAEVLGLERYAGMDLVHLDGKLVLDALDRQVLAQRLELVQRIRVVAVLLPFLFQEREGLLEDWERADICRVWLLRR